MKSSPRGLLFLSILALALPSSAGVLSREESMSLPAAGLARLILRNSSGLLECVGEDREDVKVDLVFKARSRKRDKARKLLEKSSLTVRREAEELRLEPELADGGVWVDVIVRLPRGLDMKARVGSGDLRLHGLTGRLDLAAGGSVDGYALSGEVELTGGSGEIRLRDIQGSLRIQTGSGDVSLKRIESCDLRGSSGDIEIRDVHGPCKVKTGSGDIFARKLAGPAELFAGSGDINASGLTGLLHAETGSGDQVILGLGSPGQDLRLGATSGDLDLSFLPGASYRLELMTSSGDVDILLPIELGKVTRRRLIARLGDGNDEARIETSSGDIRIRGMEETP